MWRLKTFLYDAALQLYIYFEKQIISFINSNLKGQNRVWQLGMLMQCRLGEADPYMFPPTNWTFL